MFSTRDDHEILDNDKFQYFSSHLPNSKSTSAINDRQKLTKSS